MVATIKHTKRSAAPPYYNAAQLYCKSLYKSAQTCYKQNHSFYTMCSAYRVFPLCLSTTIALLRLAEPPTPLFFTHSVAALYSIIQRKSEGGAGGEALCSAVSSSSLPTTRQNNATRDRRHARLLGQRTRFAHMNVMRRLCVSVEGGGTNSESDLLCLVCVCVCVFVR